MSWSSFLSQCDQLCRIDQEKLEINSIAIPSPIGTIWIESDHDRISRVLFEAPSAIGTETGILREAKRQFDAYFNGDLKNFDLPLKLDGTDLQKKVWNILSGIPSGRTLTYGKIASEFGGNSFARATGAACGANPLPIIIPCHRVIASSGSLTGYVGGLDRKRFLLEMEGAIAVPQKELF